MRALMIALPPLCLPLWLLTMALLWGCGNGGRSCGCICCHRRHDRRCRRVCCHCSCCPHWQTGQSMTVASVHVSHVQRRTHDIATGALVMSESGAWTPCSACGRSGTMSESALYMSRSASSHMCLAVACNSTLSLHQTCISFARWCAFAVAHVTASLPTLSPLFTRCKKNLCTLSKTSGWP